MGNQCQCQLNNIKQQQTANQIEASQQITPKSDNQPEQVINQQSTKKEIQAINQEDLKNQNEQTKSIKRVRIVFHIDDSQQSQTINDNVSVLTTYVKSSDQALISSTLDKHFIMSQLCQKQKKQIISKMQYCTASKNTYIFKKGNPSFSFYIIISGKCKVEIDQEIKKEIGEGDSFGDLGILYNAPRSASILATEDCLFARLNRSAFKQTLEKLNQAKQQENKEALQNLEFYKMLNQEQKNTLAANCITQVYSKGQVIFNKGDDSNSFYIIIQGEVTIVEKNLVLKKGEYFGLNSILQDQTTIRSSSMTAKQSCKLLSITKEIVKQNLGDNIATITKKNLALNLINESSLKQKFNEETIKQTVESIKFEKILKNDIVIKKYRKFQKGVIAFVMNTGLKSEEKCYLANSIIEPESVSKGISIIFQEDFRAENDGYFGIGKIVKKRPKSKKRKTRSRVDFNEPDMEIKDFVVVKRLQSGNFGQVYATYNTKTNQKYAVKVMDRIFMERKKYLKFVIRENQILQALTPHPFLGKYYTMFQTNLIFAIVLELIEGQDFFDAMHFRLPIPEQQVVFYIAQILSVLSHLHNQKIIYRDLKPQNLMVGLDGYLKLIDMGTAKLLTIQDRFKTKTIIGTPHYMAPEIITGKGYSFSADLWSLGIMMYEITFGGLPFGETVDDPFKIYKEIISKPFKITSVDKSAATKDLLSILLKKSPQKRQGNGIAQLMNNKFFDNIDWNSLLKKQTQAFYIPSSKKQITFGQIASCISKNESALKIFLRDREKKRKEF